jgi:hypothetical protein
MVAVGGYVFISYSHDDARYVEQLRQHLVTARLSVWTDDGIDYGNEWPTTIAKQIEGCAAFVPVMSPRSRKSDWVKREILYALDNDKPILPLLLSGKRFLELIDVQDEAVEGGRLPAKRFVDRLRTLVAGNDADASSPLPDAAATPPAGQATSNLPRASIGPRSLNWDGPAAQPPWSPAVQLHSGPDEEVTRGRIYRADADSTIRLQQLREADRRGAEYERRRAGRAQAEGRGVRTATSGEGTSGGA